MADSAVEKFGKLHVAFNKAGTFMVGAFADVNEASISMHKMLGVNFKSLVYCFKHRVLLTHKSGIICTPPWRGQSERCAHGYGWKTRTVEYKFEHYESVDLVIGL